VLPFSSGTHGEPETLLRPAGSTGMKSVRVERAATTEVGIGVIPRLF
jgi:hypothetical protein